MVGIIANNGAADATSFNAGCTYQCPGGPISSGGLDIIVGGYVGANDQLTFRQSVRIACEPVPAILNLDCSVDEGGNVQEENEGNNTAFFSVSIP